MSAGQLTDRLAATEIALHRLQETVGGLHQGAPQDAPALLTTACVEVRAVLRKLREGRDALQTSTVERLHNTSDKLREVSSTTETAATGILDGIERALILVDELDTAAPSRSEEVRGGLRDELYAVMGCVQFQDITTQQLTYAANLLTEAEARLTDLARLFEPSDETSAEQDTNSPGSPLPSTFDPVATLDRAESRQSLADEVFGGQRPTG
jgi:chemotaxis regulatin CheY-phosphate phosphatase CheZ